MKNVRHGRYALFRSPQTPAGSPTRIDSGFDFGTYQVGGYSRFIGTFASVGSFTLRWQMGVHSGDHQVSSTMLVNSGATVFDALNLGLYPNFAVTIRTSQAPRYVIIAEPIR